MKPKNTIKTGGAAMAFTMAFTMAFAAIPASAAVFANGDFDSYAGPPANAALISSLTPANWSVLGNGAFIKLRLNAPNPAQSGNYYVGLHGTNDTETGGVSQSFTTIALQQYEVTFYLSRQTSLNTPTLGITVFDGVGSSGSNLASQSVVVNWAEDTWVQQTVTFTAATADTTLRFLEATGSDTLASDVFLDSVVVTAVPEPSSLAMLGGFAMLGLARRRRN